jgi:REP element-mobilizing transposase RayT
MRQTKFVFPETWGGKRKGAGRKPKNELPGVPHVVRPIVNKHNVTHVVLRTDPSIGYLRKPDPKRAFNWALSVVGDRQDFRICQISIQGNHVHLLCEAEDRMALSRGMRAFQISAARGLNGDRRLGRVFIDRYHATIIRTPTQLRNALSYVFGNWRHHGYDRNYGRTRFDPYSSAISFGGFSELEEPEVFRIPPNQDLLRVALPKSWLLQRGWKERGGGPISCYAVPGSISR